MDETKNETEVEDVIEEETPETDLTPNTDWEAEAKKARGIAQRALTKLKKLGEVKEKVEPTIEPVKKTQNAGELDETALDYLDLKGVTEQEDIDVIQKVVLKTGQTVRQVLKDDYVLTKLAANKAARDVQAAIPGTTKRSGSGGADTFDQALAKYERTGELPADFATRSAVVNAKMAADSPNKPPWMK